MHRTALQQRRKCLGACNLVVAVVNGLQLHFGLRAIKDAHFFVAQVNTRGKADAPARGGTQGGARRRGLVAGEDQPCGVVGVSAQVCNAGGQSLVARQNGGLVRQNQGRRAGCTVASGRAVDGDTQKALGVSGRARKLDRLLGSVEVGVAVTGTFGKAVVGGHQHTLQFTVVGQRLAQELAPVAGDDLQLLAVLYRVEVDTDVFHAIGNGRNGRHRHAAAHADAARRIRVVVIDQRLCQWRRAAGDRIGAEDQRGVGAAGVVGVLGHPKLRGSGHQHRVVKRHVHAGRQACGALVKGKQRLSGFAVAVHTLLVDGVALGGKGLRQIVQRAFGAGQHLFLKSHQTSERAAGDAVERGGLAVGVEHQGCLAVGSGAFIAAYGQCSRSADHDILRDRWPQADGDLAIGAKGRVDMGKDRQLLEQQIALVQQVGRLACLGHLFGELAVDHSELLGQGVHLVDDAVDRVLCFVLDEFELPGQLIKTLRHAFGVTHKAAAQHRGRGVGRQGAR